MEHVVFFSGADGAPQFRHTQSLEEAVRVVEHLRNVEGVEDSRVYALSEVPLSFKTVYRVELPGQSVDPLAPLPPMPAMPAELDAAANAAPAEPEPPAPVMAAVPGEQYAAEAVPEPVPNGKHAGRGTGFFSR